MNEVINRSIFRFTLNMHNHRSQASVSAFRGDTGIRLIITLTDGGIPYQIARGCSAILSGTKHDKNPLWNRCVIDHETNTIIYDFTKQTANCAGIVNCEITLYDPDGHIITAPKFIIVVDEREVNLSEIPESAIELDALEQILHSENARAEAEEVRESNEKDRIFKDLDREEKIKEFDDRIERLEETGLVDKQDEYLSENYVPRMHRIDSAKQEEDGEYGYDFGYKYDRVYIERSKGKGIYNKIALSPTPSKIYNPDKEHYKEDENGNPIGPTLGSIPQRLNNGHILVPEQPGAYEWLYDGKDTYKKNYAVSRGMLDSSLDKKADKTSLNTKVDRIESFAYDRIYAEQSQNRGVVGLKLTYYAKNDIANIPQRLQDGTMQCIVTDDLIAAKEAANYGHGNLLVANVGYVKQKIAELVNSAPAALDTLGELAAALEENAVAEEVLAAINENTTAIATIRSELDELTYVPVSITSFSTDILSELEVGQTVTSVKLSWKTKGTVKSLKLTGTGMNGPETDPRIIGYAINNLSITATSGGSWELTVTGTKGETATKTVSSPTFKRRVYYGVSSAEALDATGIKGLTNRLATSKGYNWTPSCNKQYIYYCVPKTFGACSFKCGVFDGGFNEAYTVSVTNSYGHTEDYYVYRSAELLTGSISVTVT